MVSLLFQLCQTMKVHATKNVTFTIVNKTSSDVTLRYYTNYKNPIKGWNLLLTEPDTLEKTNVVDAKKRFQQLQ